MNRIFALALGPELIWTAVFYITTFFSFRNSSPTIPGNARLEVILWVLPAAGVLLSFAPFAWTPGNLWWLLLRIAVCGTIGVYLVVERLCRAIDYNDSRNSGVRAAFILFISLGYALLMIGIAVISTFFLIKTGYPHS